MTDARYSRRRFVLTAIAASSVFAVPHRWLPGGSAVASTRADPDLTHLARLLFPHEGLADEVYANVAASLFDTLAASSATAQVLDTASAALDARVDGDWIDAGETQQVAALRNIEHEAFFGTILATLRGAFYYDPRVWEHIDYPGSSKEHGGYKHRGFNDISWLPKIE